MCPQSQKKNPNIIYCAVEMAPNTNSYLIAMSVCKHFVVIMVMALAFSFIKKQEI